MFESFDPLATSCREVNSIRNDRGALHGYARDPISVGRVVDEIWPDLVRGGGRGEIYSWTVVYRPVTAEFEPPYAPAIIALDEGYQMLTNVVGVPPEDLDVGLRVRVEFRPSDVRPGGMPQLILRLICGHRRAGKDLGFSLGRSPKKPGFDCDVATCFSPGI